MQALYQWAHTGGDFADLSAQFRTRNDYHKYVDWEWFDRLVQGVFAELAAIDALIVEGAKRPLAEINPVELALLRVAVFELKICMEVPYQVVLSEYVNIASEFGSTDAHQFVNAALEQLSAQLRPLEYKHKGDNHE